MRPNINYDFSSLKGALGDMLLNGKATTGNLRTIKNEFNSFFKGSKCEDVFFTDNTDKPFFGMKVMAKFDSKEIYEYLMGSNKARIDRYSIEIDSHLLNPLLGLSADELTAICLHEVGHLINDSSPIEHAREYLDSYLADNDTSLKMTDSIHYREILAYGLTDFLARDQSMFYTIDEHEIMADDFARTYGYSEALESAFSKILKSNYKLYVGSDKVDKFITFAWSLSLYRGIVPRRIGALRLLSKLKSITGSRLEKREIENVVRRIGRIDDDVVMQESDTPIAIVKSKMRKMRYESMRSLEDDLYELNMRIRNVEDEDDAIYLMRQINTRVSIIDDYISDGDLSSGEKSRWQQTLDKFRSLREILVKSTVYKSKSYGLYVNYPDIKQDNY